MDSSETTTLTTSPPTETRVHEWSHNQVPPEDDTSPTTGARRTLHWANYVITQTIRPQGGRAVTIGVERSDVAVVAQTTATKSQANNNDNSPPYCVLSWYMVDPCHTGNCCLLPPRRPWFNLVTLSSTSPSSSRLEHLVCTLLAHPVGISYSYQHRGGDNIAFREEYELVDLSARTARLVAQQLLLLLADNNNKNNNNIVLKVDLRKVDRWCKRNPHFDTRSINRQVYCYFWPLSLNPNDPSCTSAVVDEFIDQAQRRAQIDACLMLFPLYGIALSALRHCSFFD